MIDFMVVSLPRCATTWVSNWLTTDTTLCLHDPCATYAPFDLDKIRTEKKLGICDTSIFALTKFVNQHRARKLVILRSYRQINESLMEIGLEPMPRDLMDMIHKIDAPRVQFEDLFDEKIAKGVYERLLGIPFDAERYRVLMDWEIQPHFGTWKADASAFRSFIDDMKQETAG